MSYKERIDVLDMYVPLQTTDPKRLVLFRKKILNINYETSGSQKGYKSV